MTAPWDQARSLQPPLPNGSFDIVARGVKTDGLPDFLPEGGGTLFGGG